MTAQPAKLRPLRAKYGFRWDVLDIIVSGKSSIDSPKGFSVTDADAADRFIQSYGYQLANPIEGAEVLGNFHEALSLVRRYFLSPDNPQGLKLEMPRKLTELTDVRDLLLMANLRGPGQQQPAAGGAPDPASTALRDWACATLKVMHTIAHIDKDIRAPHFPEIQKQIFDRYYRFIHRDADERLYLGHPARAGEDPQPDPYRVNLVAFETKPKKSRESTILKLLHKPENVAEELFDRVGVRFVTESRLDALRVVKFLKDAMVVMPPNIKPSRSRNSLVDLDRFRVQLEGLLSRAEAGEMDEAALAAALEGAIATPGAGAEGENPHTRDEYKSIQFTCRQLIKLRIPLYDELKDLRARAKALAADGDEAVAGLRAAIERIDLKSVQRELRFFYPYEVQVVDRASFEENERGRSAHSDYKRSQIQAALRRVMGPLGA